MQELPLTILLKNYYPENKAEIKFKKRMLNLIETEQMAFFRESLKAHFTGSAFIINNEKTKALFVKHGKLNLWLQPGGHCDGETDVAAVALKESFEETGLKDLTIDNSKIFDLDIHTIPERKGVPEHQHFDVRFLIIANEKEEPKISDESIDIQWVRLYEVGVYNKDESIMRMVRKVT
jgi:8-oxo-dGTP pyrophosphatase MutT (NUDIX family)